VRTPAAASGSGWAAGMMSRGAIHQLEGLVGEGVGGPSDSV